jgi:signal transduction histidine kinase
MNLEPPPVFIERFLADRRPIGLPAPGSVADLPFVSVKPGRGELEFHFTALQFRTPEKCRFKYKLGDIDADWVEAGTHRLAHYNNIYPGSYCFRVVACNHDGVWNEQGASLQFELLPHYWQTWWFRSVSGLAVLSGVGGGARYVTQRRMQRKLEILEQRRAVEAERARIAQDIHDELGSSLTRIMMLGERAQEDLARREEAGAHVGKIVSFARSTVQSLDEIVWAVNPENDTLEGLIGYLSQYADQFFEGTNIRCRLEMPGALPPVRLPAEVRHDLFLVVKEALNNAVKHSGATEVRLQVAKQEEFVEISVQDNGCGFKYSPTGQASSLSADGSDRGRRGHGLPNMRERMARLGGQLAFETTPGEGTRIKLSLRLAG